MALAWLWWICFVELDSWRQLTGHPFKLVWYDERGDRVVAEKPSEERLTEAMVVEALIHGIDDDYVGGC